MCGIAGVFTNRRNGFLHRPLERMVGAMPHRGPDSQGVRHLAWRQGRLGLGGTRLAILDLSSGGLQPMEEPETGNCLVYNGEVYNFRALREELSGRNGSWNSTSDTEVLLRGYGRWGISVLRKIRGMFAFAVWDARREQLLLARDPFGIKPLYYFWDRGSFVFASEVRTLLASGLVPRRLSREGLISYLEWGAVRAPETLVRGVRCLPPGSYVTVRTEGVGLRVLEDSYVREFRLDGGVQPPKGREDAVARLRELLEESVRLHLLSDVPVGVFLSGGLDSSALVALMSRVSRQAPRTFSVGFAEREFNEARYSRGVARRFRSRHQEIVLTEGEMLKILPEALERMDQPTMDGMNTYVISKVVKQAGITVALSGLGGDELFAGYPSFRRARLLHRFPRMPSGIRHGAARVGRRIWNRSVRLRKAWALMEGDGSPRSACRVSRHVFFPPDLERILWLPVPTPPPAPPEPPRCSDPVNEVSLEEIRGYMANTLLRDTDAMSMAHSLEVRVPYVDSVVVPYVLAIPGAWKLDPHRPKPLLLDALGGLLPEEVWRRRKMGFALPFERWMGSELAVPLREELCHHAEKLVRLGFRPEGPREVWERFARSPRRVGWTRPWSLFVLSRWCERNGVEL